LIGFQHISRNHSGYLLVRRIVGRLHGGLDLGPSAIRHLIRDIAGLVRQTALAQAMGEDLLDGTDQAWRAIGGDLDRLWQTTLDHISQEIKSILVGFLVAQRQVEHDPTPISTNGPGTQDTFLAAALFSQRLVYRIQEQVLHLKARQVAW